MALTEFRRLSSEDQTALLSRLRPLGIVSVAQFEVLLQMVSTSHVSGGVNLNSQSATVGGDVVGRDQVISAGGDVVHQKLVVEALPPDVRELLKQAVKAVIEHPRLQGGLYAAARAAEPDLELDFAALAQRLRDQQTRGDPLAVAEREQAVYVPLALKFSRHRRVSAQAPFEQDQTFDDIVAAVQAARAVHEAEPYPALALLGTPGGGKSTALRHLALDRLNRLWADAGAHLPLFINLGDYREEALSKLRRAYPEDDLPLTPLNFLRAHWYVWFGDDGFGRALMGGRLWFILDGLNEIPNRDDRIPDWAAFFEPHTGAFAAPNRAIVACRRADYGNRLDLPYLDLEELDWDHIREFVGKRLQKLGQIAIDEVLSRLQADADLLEVVSNPFWLKMLTDYAADCGGALPEGRTDLIDWFVDKWLRYGHGRADLPALPPDEIEALKTALEPFAYWLLDRSDNAPVDWTEAVQCCGAWGEHRRDEVLKRASRASLLVREASGVKFYHQLILEYFAGRQLAQRFRRTEDVTARWRIPWTAWQFVNTEWRRLAEPPTTRWEEATAFAAARPEVNFDAFVRAVLAENPPLAARCVIELGPRGSDPLRAAVIGRLLALVERRDPAVREVAEPSAQLSLRIAAGHALGRLGDPRSLTGQGRVTLQDTAVEFIEPRWCPVKAGPFTMGSNSKDAYPSEKPEHPCDVIKQDYQIGLFPMTNAEYDCFVKAGGYDNQAYWTPQGWAWRQQDISTAQPPGWIFWNRNWSRDNLDWIRQWPERGIGQPAEVDYREALAKQTDEEVTAAWRDRELRLSRARNPWRDDRDLNGANQPVVGVCWYEALAYCAWLTHVLRAAGRIRSDQEVTLPNEPEWEKAARPLAASKKGRGSEIGLYPWGYDAVNQPFHDRTNTLNGRVLTTTPVGVYDNASGCGALDMSGNVWEWTRSRWGADPQTPTFGYPYSVDLAERERLDADDYRIIRGGSWLNVASNARCTYRGRYTPDNRNNHVGFRCVLQVFIA
ncbi:MAG: SUMF1/EgtB/PvdO family nonheme iron enzyme [Chloroflexi bacterium]|nr:SUMF1/EgtB/PvdO family nonheme iron enzyme [Chloroflexota bacterium]